MRPPSPAGTTACPCGPAALGHQPTGQHGNRTRDQETYFTVKPKQGERLASTLPPRAVFARRAHRNSGALPCSQPGAVTGARRGALSTDKTDGLLWSAPTATCQGHPRSCRRPAAERASKGEPSLKASCHPHAEAMSGALGSTASPPNSWAGVLTPDLRM